MTKPFKIASIILISFIIFGLGAGAGYSATQYFNHVPSVGASNAPQDIGLFWDVWNIIENNFYGDIPDDSQATYGAIHGAVDALGDPFTLFVEPKPRALEKAALDGEFGGIGAYIYRGDNGDVVLEPIVASPAEEAGLQKGDMLIQVDDTPLQPEMTTDEIVLLIRGKVGTMVNLVVTREGETDPITISVKRDLIETPSMDWRITDEDSGIGYIAIRIFSGKTGEELARAVDELKADGATRFIVDLRGNGGGLLDAAIDVSSIFLDSGVILRENRRDADPKIYKVKKSLTKLPDEPLIVLVDGGTASASEIVSGALQDHHRAQLVGEKTYGKGSVQLVFDLSDGSSLHVTVARWATPDDHKINGIGLTPDVEVEFSEEDHASGRDPQYLKAIELLQAE